jgi:hypothetical protein
MKNSANVRYAFILLAACFVIPLISCDSATAKNSGGAGAGKVKVKEFTIKKTTDTASPSKTSGSGKGSTDGPTPHNYDLKANKGG